jgi:hypothetical protein
MIFWLDQDQKIEVEQPEASNVSEMYKLLSEDTKENIVVAHQIPRAVAGLATPGSLGSTKEMLEGTEIPRTNFIKPIQEFFLARFNMLMEINGLENIELTAPSPNLLKYTLDELAKHLTPAEIREFLGKEPLAEERITDEIKKKVADAETIEEKN